VVAIWKVLARTRSSALNGVESYMKFQETDLGFEFKTDKYFVFFGKKDSSLENLRTHFTDFIFKPLWQIHGNDLLHTMRNSEDNLKADAHWTADKNVALISKSADCIPFFGFDEKNNRVLAIHAGWRGVQNRIIPKSLQTLGSQWKCFLGPHIMKNSFEIQNDCFELLKSCTKLAPSEWFSNHHADLYKIVEAQLAENPNFVKNLSTILFDTKTDMRFHSFRRSGTQAGRQNSFIVLL
jgi:copper oxidase (laccase) domain-containing protein